MGLEFGEKLKVSKVNKKGSAARAGVGLGWILRRVDNHRVANVQELDQKVSGGRSRGGSPFVLFR